MNSQKTTTNRRSAAVTFAVFWLAILTVFSFGSNYANALAVYSLLALLVGAKSTCLVRRDAPRAVSGALAYAGALAFGPIGGLTVGLAAGTGAGVCGASAKSVGRVLRGGIQAGFVGLVIGLVKSYLQANVEPGPYASIAITLGPAVAGFALLMMGELLDGYQRYWVPANRRIHGNRIAIEFGVGVAVAAISNTLHLFTDWQPILFLTPLAYLVNESLLESLIERSVYAMRGRDSQASIYLATIESLVCAIDAKEKYKCYHTKGVERTAVAIAQQMRLSPHEVEGIRTAALLHDIGRLGVPEHILHKPGKLDQQEFERIQAHSTIGQKILDNVRFPWPVGSMIRSHHERWDGTGYPDKLKGEEIPLGARILAVADVYDAMTNKRSYRADSSPDQAIDYIKNSAGKQFDADVVTAFIEALDRFGLPDCVSVHGHGDQGQETDTQVKMPGAQSRETTIASDISMANDEFLAMYEIAQTASTSLNMEEVLPLLATKIRNMVSCSTCSIFLRDEQEPDRLHCRITVGVNDGYLEDSETLVGHGLTGLVAYSAEGLISRYDRNDLILKRLYIQWIELQSVMIVPIVSDGQTIGTINLYDIKAEAFSMEDLRLLNVVAPQVGRALSNAQLFQETRESALRDPLTGLHNARYMLIQLEQEMNRAQRAMKPVSLLGLDLDNFKPINDTFGHQQGDQVLRELGQIFISLVRDYDVVCRYAGDEFIIVLPDSDKAAALETAERIKAAVDAYDPGFHHDQPIRVGVSVGVATFPGDASDVRSLISEADAAMYADKRERKSERKAA